MRSCLLVRRNAIQDPINFLAMKNHRLAIHSGSTGVKSLYCSLMLRNPVLHNGDARFESKIVGERDSSGLDPDEQTLS
jgi:hypothetical protein